MARILAVTGDAAVGKTTLIDSLASRLGWNRLGVDSERSGGGDWDSLVSKVSKATTPTLVESILMPNSYKRALIKQDALVVYCTCDETVRQERISDRAYAYYSTEPLPRPRFEPLDVVHFDLTDGLSDEELADLVSKATRKVFAAYTY